MIVKEIALMLSIALTFTLGVVIGLFGPNSMPYLLLVVGSGSSLFFAGWLLIEVAKIKEVTK